MAALCSSLSSQDLQNVVRLETLQDSCVVPFLLLQKPSRYVPTNAGSKTQGDHSG
jgi:hypothetical protein